MKKVTFLMALAVAAGMASCTAQSPKADLKTDIDSLSYAIGMARTEGLDQYLAQQGIDSTQMSEFLKGFNEGAVHFRKRTSLHDFCPVNHHCPAFQIWIVRISCDHPAVS